MKMDDEPASCIYSRCVVLSPVIVLDAFAYARMKDHTSLLGIGLNRTS